MEKRESLTARYERVLGRTLPDFESDSAQADSRTTPETTPSSSRRREQILHAQRTHRHRTQQYIRELEKEVFRLRDDNQDLRRTVNRMRSAMERMKSTLDGAGLALESENCEIVFSEEGDWNEWQGQEVQQPLTFHDARAKYVSAVPYVDTTVSVDLTGLAGVVPQGSCENHPAEIDPPTYYPSSSVASQEVAFVTAQPHNSTAVALNDEITAQLGINFVLSLETPCLSHVKHAHLGYSTGTTPRGITYNSGPGHLLTASAMLARRYRERDLEGSILQLPTLEIEQLLDASARLKLDGEITPVQIWARIRDVDRKRRGDDKVTEEVVRRLLREFEKYVYCNSFGAVVESGTVAAVLADTIGLDREHYVPHTQSQRV